MRLLQPGHDRTNRTGPHPARLGKLSSTVTVARDGGEFNFLTGLSFCRIREFCPLSPGEASSPPRATQRSRFVGLNCYALASERTRPIGLCLPASEQTSAAVRSAEPTLYIHTDCRIRRAKAFAIFFEQLPCLKERGGRSFRGRRPPAKIRHSASIRHLRAVHGN